jgi:hypothetical protein
MLADEIYESRFVISMHKFAVRFVYKPGELVCRTIQFIFCLLYNTDDPLRRKAAPESRFNRLIDYGQGAVCSWLIIGLKKCFLRKP